MKKIHRECKLVHADLSEYNMLWFDNKVWIIDVSQAVEIAHPAALEFLFRDCSSVTTVSMDYLPL
jgi:RIO kinase 3